MSIAFTSCTRRLVFLLCTLTAIGVGVGVPGQLQDGDAADLPLNLVVDEVGWSGSGLAIGRVRAISSTMPGGVFEIMGDLPNDGFGWHARVLDDLNGDGTPEFAIASPRRGWGSDRIGSVRLYNGHDGRAMLDVRGGPGERFGLWIDVCVDHDMDGSLDIAVWGMGLDRTGRVFDRVSYFSSGDGRYLGDSIRCKTHLPPLLKPGSTFQWGDLNQDNSTDAGDVPVMVDFLASSSDAPEADLDFNSVVNTADLQALVDAVAVAGDPVDASPIGPHGPLTVTRGVYRNEQGELRPVEATEWAGVVPYTDPVWAEAADAMAEWSWLYPEDPVSVALTGVSLPARTAPNWWNEDGTFRESIEGVLLPAWHGWPGSLEITTDLPFVMEIETQEPDPRPTGMRLRIIDDWDEGCLVCPATDESNGFSVLMTPESPGLAGQRYDTYWLRYGSDCVWEHHLRDCPNNWSFTLFNIWYLDDLLERQRLYCYVNVGEIPNQATGPQIPIPNLPPCAEFWPFADPPVAQGISGSFEFPDESLPGSTISVTAGYQEPGDGCMDRDPDQPCPIIPVARTGGVGASVAACDQSTIAAPSYVFEQSEYEAAVTTCRFWECPHDDVTYAWSVVSSGGIAVTLQGASSPAVTVGVGDGDARDHVTVLPGLVEVTLRCVLHFTQDQGGNCSHTLTVRTYVVIDSDNDGLVDVYEDGNEDPGPDPSSGGCVPSLNPLLADSDGDGLDDLFEIDVLCSSPWCADTDGDGALDGCEYELGLDPCTPDDLVFSLDRDHDGLRDIEEALACGGIGTDPFSIDTDGDGNLDGCEADNPGSMDPLDPAVPGTGDSDGDGLPDGQELCSGTDPYNPDTDGDGLTDEEEARYMACSDPLNPDTDGDGLLDGEEVNVHMTSQCDTDSDDDGLTDSFELRWAIPFSDSNGQDIAAVSLLALDPTDPDTDDDGVLDGDEDFDGDGLTNREEERWDTNPHDADTDGDGESDGDEANGGSHPGDARSSLAGGDNEWYARVRFRVHSNGGQGSRYLKISGGGVSHTTGSSAFGSDSDDPEELVLLLRRGETYSIRSVYDTTESSYWSGTCLHDMSYCASVSAAGSDQGPMILKDPDGVLSCQSVTCYDDHRCDPAGDKSATLTLPIIDLDIDSDNTEGFAPPSRLPHEDEMEDAPDRNGKLVVWHGGDVDFDGRADTCDGFDLTGQGHDDLVDSGGVKGFIPVVLEVAGLCASSDPDGYSLEFSYNASDPRDIQVIDQATQRFEMPDGALRLWTKDQGVARSRSSAGAPSQQDAGDFVPSGEPVPFSRLGLDPQEGGEVTLFLESVRFSDAVGDMRISVTVTGQGAPAIDDAVRCTVPRLVPEARSYASGTVSDPYDPQSVLPASDPRPHVEFEIIDQGVQSPSVDPATGELVVWAHWRVADPLSGVVPVSQTLQEVRFFADGVQIDAVTLADQIQPSATFPFQRHELDVSGVIELRMPAPTGENGVVRSWGSSVVAIEARTSANAVGHVGFDRSAVIFDLDEVTSDQPGAFLAVEDDPDDPDDAEIFMRSRIDRVERLARSPAGVLETIVMRVSPIDPETAAYVTIEMIASYAALQGSALVQPEHLEIVSIDPGDPNTHYVVFSDPGDPDDYVQLVFISDEGFDTGPITPQNIRRIRSGDETTYRISAGSQGPALPGYEHVKVITIAEYQSLLLATEAPPLDERPLNEGDIRTFYELMATDDRAVLRLEVFDALQGEIVIRDMGPIPFTDWLTGSYKVSRNGRTITIDDDSSPAEAALDLMRALKFCAGKSSYWEQSELYMLNQHQIVDNYDDYVLRAQAMIDNLSGQIGPIVQAIPMIASIINEPTDWVITVGEVADGNYMAAIGFLPAVPAALFQAGKAVKFVMPDGSLFRVVSKQAADDIEAVWRGVAPLSHAEAVGKLRDAGMSVQHRVMLIEADELRWLPQITRNNSRTDDLRAAMMNHYNSPVPGDLAELSKNGSKIHQPQIHHILPMQHADWFVAHGIDINDPKYLKWMRPSEHRRLHGVKRNIDPDALDMNKYNEWWRQLQGRERVRMLNGGDEYSVAEIEDFITDVMQEFRVVQDAGRAEVWAVSSP